MKRRNWKTWVPRSPCASIEGCVEHGTQRYNRGVERLAIDHLGQTSQSSLYKCMANGRLPLCLVVPLEKATGIPLITRYLAAAHGKLLIDIPTGRTTSPKDVQQLQTVLHDAAWGASGFPCRQPRPGQHLGRAAERAWSPWPGTTETSPNYADHVSRMQNRIEEINRRVAAGSMI
ncbi:hypothetical protein PUN16_030705 [Pseudomonas aeruginosa]|uniref:hypothetical protein n=1 Tax=Pseudomonas aeruginosa TaxID=287 RepID=UPI0023AEF111|nr:hypothetical protein [Pseudomonas aeruginosa]MDE8666933.1 hypothetical protein [Pseudomonas aeruginosa]